MRLHKPLGGGDAPQYQELKRRHGSAGGGGGGGGRGGGNSGGSGGGSGGGRGGGSGGDSISSDGSGRAYPENWLEMTRD